mgnify:CR=1 FL=1
MMVLALFGVVFAAALADLLIPTEDGGGTRQFLHFLTAFLPCLRTWLIENGYYDRCYFHISDEPSGEVKENFIFIKNVIKKYFPSREKTFSLNGK